MQCVSRLADLEVEVFESKSLYLHLDAIFHRQQLVVARVEKIKSRGAAALDNVVAGGKVDPGHTEAADFALYRHEGVRVRCQCVGGGPVKDTSRLQVSELHAGCINTCSSTTAWHAVYPGEDMGRHEDVNKVVQTTGGVCHLPLPVRLNVLPHFEGCATREQACHLVHVNPGP